MKHLLMTLAALSALFSTTPVFASCPDFLNHSMRKLASTEEVQFCEAYEGKALLIVNTASYCGYTSQFESLEKVHRPTQTTVWSYWDSPATIFFRKTTMKETPPRSALRSTT